MMRYTVVVERTSYYAVEADDETQAVDIALDGGIEEYGGETTHANAYLEPETAGGTITAEMLEDSIETLSRKGEA